MDVEIIKEIHNRVLKDSSALTDVHLKLNF